VIVRKDTTFQVTGKNAIAINPRSSDDYARAVEHASQELAHALTFHAFEIESIENDILDVKVTPNRGHDCLSHRGIAKELAAILNIPMTKDPFGADKGGQFDMSATITVSVADAALCPRYIAWAIKGVKVGPSPDWLKRRLESIGERSINNIVDATNYVMFTLGQPLHAFDADMLKVKNPKIRGTTEYAVGVRLAKAGEKITSLDGKVYELSESNLLIVKGESDEPARRSINDDDAAREEEPGWGIISLGALAHGLMSLKAALRRRIEASHARREPALAAAGGAPLRREPVFDAAERAPRRPAPDDDGSGEERGGPEPSRRVAPPPAAPKPGKRLSRDAQPSLLDGE